MDTPVRCIYVSRVPWNLNQTREIFMSPTLCDDEMYRFLRRLEQSQLLSIREMNGDEIVFAEKLCELSLACKLSTKLTTFYFYGSPDGVQCE